MSDKLDLILARVEALEANQRYQTKLLEDCYEIMSQKQHGGAEKQQQVRQTLERMRTVVQNATGGNKQIMDVFDKMLESAGA